MKMSAILIWLGVIVLVYVTAQLIYSGYYYFKGQNLAKTSYSRITSLGEPTDPEYKLFITGDSVAAGVGATSFETSMAGRLGEYFAKDKKVNFENVAVSGHKVENVVAQNPPSEPQDLIVLVVSSNNFFRLTSLEEFKTNVEKLFAKYSPLATQVVLIGPGRVYDASSIPLVLKPIYLLQGPKYAEILKTESGKYQNIVYVNPLENPASQEKYGNTFAADRFHPNDSGHRYWADLIVENLP